MRQKRDTGELTRMPPPQEMSTSTPFLLGQTWDDESQVSETRKRKIEMVSVPFTTCPFLGCGRL